MATSRSLNKVMIVGNLTRNPVLKTTPTGATVCTFGVATNSTWKDEQGEIQERTEFHNLVSWNKLAEICAQLLSVGMLIFVEGEIRTRTWDDENGVRHYRTEVRIVDMKLLDSKGKSGVGVEQAHSEGEKDAGGSRSSKKTSAEVSEDKKKSEDEEEKSSTSSDQEKEKEKEKEEAVDPADLPF